MRIPMPNKYKEEFKPLLNFQRRIVGTVGSSDVDNEQMQLPHSAKRSVFNSSELDEIKKVLLWLNSTSPLPVVLISLNVFYPTLISAHIPFLPAAIPHPVSAAHKIPKAECDKTNLVKKVQATYVRW